MSPPTGELAIPSSSLRLAPLLHEGRVAEAPSRETMRNPVKSVALGAGVALAVLTGCGGRGVDPERPWEGRWKLVAVDGKDVSRTGASNTYAADSFESTWFVGGRGACFVVGDLRWDGIRYAIRGIRLSPHSGAWCQTDTTDDIGVFRVSGRGRVLDVHSESRGRHLTLVKPMSAVPKFFLDNARKLRVFAGGLMISFVVLATVHLAARALQRHGRLG